MNLAQVAVEDDAARTHVIFYTGVSMQGEIAVGKVITYAAAYLAPFVFIYAGNHQEVGNIHLVNEILAFLQLLFHQCETFGIDGVRLVQVDAARHAADQEVGMRVLSAEDGMYFDNLFLPFQCFEVMDGGNQVLFRCQFVGRVPPIPVGEDAQLTAGDELLELVLHFGEIAFRVFGPRRQLLGEEGSRFRVCLEAGDNVDPVEGMQLVEMHRMVVHVEHRFHDVAHHFGIGRNTDAERILDGANRAKRVDGGTHAANTAYEHPGIARVAVAYYVFDSAYHRTGTVCIFDFAIFDGCLYPEMTFDTGNRVYNDSFRHGVANLVRW